jgi:hypothetical protein
VVDIGPHDVSLAKVCSVLRCFDFCSAILCYVGGKFVCKMIPSSSFCCLCCMVLVAVRFCLHFRIHVYCAECAMHMLILSYMFWCILCVRDVVFLLIFQYDQHANYYRFCILINIRCYSLLYLVVFCRGVGRIWCCQFERLYSSILKQIGNLVYEWTVISEGDPFFFCYVRVGVICVFCFIIFYIRLK